MARDALSLPNYRSDRPERRPPPRSAAEEPSCEDFFSVLEQMTPAERLGASRHGGFSRRERLIWVARFPEEVPLVNGEYEWIALGGADLD